MTNKNIDKLISPELEDMIKEWELERDKLDRIKSIPAGENYIRQRYPVNYNFTRSELQELAGKNIKRLLTEDEIQQLQIALMSSGDGYDDLRVAIIDAICEVTNQEINGAYEL